MSGSHHYVSRSTRRLVQTITLVKIMAYYTRWQTPMVVSWTSSIAYCIPNIYTITTGARVIRVAAAGQHEARDAHAQTNCERTKPLCVDHGLYIT